MEGPDPHINEGMAPEAEQEDGDERRLDEQSPEKARGGGLAWREARRRAGDRQAEWSGGRRLAVTILSTSRTGDVDISKQPYPWLQYGLSMFRQEAHTRPSVSSPGFCPRNQSPCPSQSEVWP